MASSLLRPAGSSSLGNHKAHKSSISSLHICPDHKRFCLHDRKQTREAPLRRQGKGAGVGLMRRWNSRLRVRHWCRHKMFVWCWASCRTTTTSSSFFFFSFFLNFSSVVGVFALFHFHSTHSVDGAFLKNTCYLYNSSLSLFLSRLQTSCLHSVVLPP